MEVITEPVASDRLRDWLQAMAMSGSSLSLLIGLRHRTDTEAIAGKSPIFVLVRPGLTQADVVNLGIAVAVEALIHPELFAPERLDKVALGD